MIPDPSRPDREVVIIGAGIGGLGAAIALRRAGFDDLVLLERADDIGGTWRDNTYPGVAVDIPSQAYQFSFDLKPDWSRTFAPGHEVKAYIDDLADRHDLRAHVRLGVEVISRTWDDDAHLWQLRLRSTDGHDTAERTMTARFVVSAIGAFVSPKTPDIAGLDHFRGTVITSARWDHTHDLTAERVAIIGTGASAVQIVPEIASRVARLDVYQRTPIWVGPKIDPPTPPWLQRLYARVPAVQEVARRTAARGTELLLIDLVVHHRRVAWLTNRPLRALRSLWYRSQVRDPEVRRKLTPEYGLGCKRPSVSSRYLATFNRANVELVTEPIAEVTSTGVRTTDGSNRFVDTLILATGFHMASDPEVFRRSPVRGRDGFDLATFYATERLQSYESVSIPGLPNHFMIFGPYGWTGGTWHELVETASAHIVRVLDAARQRGATAVEVRPEASQAWTERMRRRLEPSLFNTNNCATARSYYFDHHGDTPFLRPTSAAAARRAARTFPLDDYTFRRPHDPPPTDRDQEVPHDRPQHDPDAAGPRPTADPHPPDPVRVPG